MENLIKMIKKNLKILEKFIKVCHSKMTNFYDIE